MIYQADWLLTLDGPPLKKGWLSVEDGRINAIGSAEQLSSNSPLQYFEGCVLMPGLINAHCHLELTALEGGLEPRKSFPEWVGDLQGVTANYKPEDFGSSAREGIARLLRGGCTTVLDVGNSGSALKALVESPLRAFACVEVLGLDPAAAQTRFQKALNLAKTEEASDRFHPGLAPHAAYSSSVELLRAVVDHQTSQRLPLTIHAAESREEAELFASASGPMQEFCKRIYPDAPEHRDTSPIAWLESEGLLPDNALIIHGNHLDDADMDILMRRKSTVVHCPSSHAFFAHKPFPYHALRARGIPVCLGTDSLASGDSLSMLDQIRMFSVNFPDAPADEILRMSTTVAANALGFDDVLGKLNTGFNADFIAVQLSDFEKNSGGNLSLSALIQSPRKVEGAVIAGKPVSLA